MAPLSMHSIINGYDVSSNNIACPDCCQYWIYSFSFKRILKLASLFVVTEYIVNNYEMKSLVEIKNFLAPSSKFDDQKFEFIFVLDRSGSMSGNNILLARRALVLFLRSLPTTCMFNVVGFGSTFDKLFTNSVTYTEESQTTALNYANAMNADLGMTELFPPLQHLYSSHQHPGYLTQIFVLTDGAVSNPNAVMKLIEDRKSRCRVFSLGIGRGASRSLVDGVASVGGGTSIYAQDNEKIETKILHQLKVALQPSLLKAVPISMPA